jgi:hypothetical protein
MGSSTYWRGGWVPWGSGVLWPARPMRARPSYGLEVLVPMT